MHHQAGCRSWEKLLNWSQTEWRMSQTELSIKFHQVFSWKYSKSHFYAKNNPYFKPMLIINILCYCVWGLGFAIWVSFYCIIKNT